MNTQCSKISKGQVSWVMVLILLLVGISAPPAWAPNAPSLFILSSSEGIPHRSLPEVTAKSFILYDQTAGVVLADQEADLSRPMASATKIMTTVVALENSSLEELVEVSEQAAAVGESEIGLVPGESLQMGTLLTAAMVRSANDAAMAVAEHVGGTVGDFVDMMNEKAAELGMDSTSFANPHGLDEPDHHSSAIDLLHLAQYAMALPEFAGLARTREVSLLPAPDGTERIADSTNHLLSDYPGANGIKTGFTSGAGLVLVGAAQREGRQLLVVVMGSEGSRSHFADGSLLLDFGFDQTLPYSSVLGEMFQEAEPPPPPDPIQTETETREESQSLEPVSPRYRTVVRSGTQTEWSAAVGWMNQYWEWMFGSDG